VLALLAFACFPVLAQADGSGIQYKDAVQTATGDDEIPTRSESPAHSSKANGGASAATDGGSGASSAGAENESSGGSPSSGAGKGPGAGSDAGNGQSSRGGDSGRNPQGAPQQGAPLGAASSDDGSSPLVPILIAIAVLAAITIGAVLLRKRRRDGDPGIPVSPKAS
jgi:cobalamin biosynthesis Mg chelatase CobN